MSYVQLFFMQIAALIVLPKSESLIAKAVDFSIERGIPERHFGKTLAVASFVYLSACVTLSIGVELLFFYGIWKLA